MNAFKNKQQTYQINTIVNWKPMEKSCNVLTPTNGRQKTGSGILSKLEMSKKRLYNTSIQSIAGVQTWAYKGINIPSAQGWLGNGFTLTKRWRCCFNNCVDRFESEQRIGAAGLVGGTSHAHVYNQLNVASLHLHPRVDIRTWNNDIYTLSTVQLKPDF